MNQANANEMKFNSKILKSNADAKDNQSYDALARGSIAAGMHLRETAKMIGSQRAAMGAGNLDISSGTPLGILSETASLGSFDGRMIEFNASREAQGYQNSARQDRANAFIERSKAKNLTRKQSAINLYIDPGI